MFRLRGTSDAEAPASGAQRTDAQPPQAQEPRGTPARLRIKQGDTEMVHELGAESFTPRRSWTIWRSERGRSTVL